jgi:alpha(1,3/1,4) fucosyltransferase
MTEKDQVSINFCKPTLRGTARSQPELCWYARDLLSRRYALRFDEKPDFLIYGDAGAGEHLNYPPGTIRIFATGENVSANWDEADYGLTHERVYSERHWRVPMWRHWYDADRTRPMRDFETVKARVDRFCNFIYSNDRARERVDFFDLLSRYKRVDAGGKVRNNLQRQIEDKMEFVSRCKFTIAFENESHEGYSTEKIIHPLIQGSIPIYWGDTSIERDFNPECLINVHRFKDFQAVVEEIIRIDQDDGLWRKYVTAPVFADNRMPAELSDTAFFDFFQNIFSKRRRFVSRPKKLRQRVHHSFLTSASVRRISNMRGNSTSMMKRLYNVRRRWREVVGTVAALEKSRAEVDLRLSNVERCLDTLIASPTYCAGAGTGLNGQIYRKEVFERIHGALQFESIIETGTFMGDSTGYFAGTTCAAVFTSEVNPRFLKLAKRRLEQFGNVHYYQGDSRSFLKEMTGRAVSDRPVFFYLDAHWYSDLPLNEEIDLICSHWTKPVLMIDDFKVPKDPGYGFDCYGEEKALCLSLIQPVLEKHCLRAYFPTTPAVKETGAKRGYVLLTKEALANEMTALRHLIEPV